MSSNSTNRTNHFPLNELASVKKRTEDNESNQFNKVKQNIIQVLVE